MAEQEEIITTLRSHFSELAAEYGVARIGVFGSFARGNYGKDSDVDLVIEFDRPLGFQFIQLVERLEQLLGRKVDVLTPAGVAGIRVKRVAQAITDDIVYV